MVQRRRPGASFKWLSIAGTAAVVVAGIGAACYMLWTSSSSSTARPEQALDKKPRPPSRMIIITKKVASQETIDWNQVLEEDVVLLVVPGVSFLEDREQGLAHRYKVIRCDTMAGLWSCARHLQKNQLLYLKDEDSGEIPADIFRYVKQVIGLETCQQLQASLA